MSVGLKITGILAACLAVGGLAGYWTTAEPDTLTFLSVGQGDCAVFRSAGVTVLIDTGPRTPTFDAGEKIVVPKLRAMGVESVDLVLLSHPDLDHVGGLGAIKRAYPNLKVGVSGDFRGFPAMEKALDAGGVIDDQVIWLGPENVSQVGSFTFRLECPHWKAGEPDNDGSMFIRVSNNTSSAVLSGDASSVAEAIEAPQINWSAQVLKAGHHGSKSASSEVWLETVHPKYDVISCGRNNPYGHPHKVVLDRLAADHIQALRTDQVGDIEFKSTPDGFEPVSH